MIFTFEFVNVLFWGVFKFRRRTTWNITPFQSWQNSFTTYNWFSNLRQERYLRTSLVWYIHDFYNHSFEMDTFVYIFRLIKKLFEEIILQYWILSSLILRVMWFGHNGLCLCKKKLKFESNPKNCLLYIKVGTKFFSFFSVCSRFNGEMGGILLWTSFFFPYLIFAESFQWLITFKVLWIFSVKT